MISPLANEPLINNILAEELELLVELVGKGLWGFRWEEITKLRITERKAV